MSINNYRNMFLIAVLLVAGRFFACSGTSGPEDPDGLRRRIAELEGVNVVELVPYYDFSREFLLEIEQPVDHGDSASATFIQRAYLLHRDEASPMVLACGGYAAYSDDLHEMSVALDANQIAVTHRYFSGAVPGSRNYDFLTTEQAAADLHRIVELFTEIYDVSWLSSGFGKGGIMALSHRRFYPDDVAVTVVYATPFLKSQTDVRPLDYIRELGSDNTHARIQMFQEALLHRRSEIMPYILNFINYTAYHYYYGWSLNADAVLELAVLEYPFDYWSNYNQIDSELPDTSESAEVLFGHLYDTVWLEYFSDDYIAYLMPYYYQSLTELGAVAHDCEHLRDLFEIIEPDSFLNVSYEIFAPSGVDISYRESVMTDLLDWLKQNGDNIIYLYGQNDPITPTADELAETATNAIMLVQPGQDHYLSLTEFSEAQQVYDALTEWLGTDVVEPLSKTGLTVQTERIQKIPLK